MIGRESLLAAIKERITDACGGRVIREQVTTLYLARRL